MPRIADKDYPPLEGWLEFAGACIRTAVYLVLILVGVAVLFLVLPPK